MNKLRKRRIKNVLLQNRVKIIIILFTLFLFALSGGYALLKSTSKISGLARIITEDSCDTRYTWEIKNQWGDNAGKTMYNIALTIYNDTDEDILIDNIQIKGPSDMTITINGNPTYNDGIATITFEDYEWNSTVSKQDSKEFDMTISTVEDSLNISWVKINGCGGSSNDKDDSGEDNDKDDSNTELVKLELEPENNTLEVGETLSLGVIKSPSNASAKLTWSSSNENVATVNNGIVTAVGEGSAVITVSSNTISATANITVSAKTEPDTPSVGDSLITVSFTPTNTWGNTCQFSMEITNNTENDILDFSFELDVPESTTFSIYYFTDLTGLTVENNTFIFKISDWAKISPGSTSTLSGQMTVPNGYDINDYISPKIKSVIIN